MDNALAPWRTALAAAAVIAAANLLVLGVGHLSGADMHVAQTAAAAPTQVGIGQVLPMSVAPAILGGLALWLAARRSVRAWITVAWLGLALGVLTIPMPFTVQASVGTSVTLAGMHLVASLVWFTAVRSSAAHQHAPSVAQAFQAA